MSGSRVLIYTLGNKRYDGAENIPVIKIEYLKKEIDILKYDALIFSSKNAVFAIDRVSREWREIPSFSIGSGTSKVIKELGGVVEYEAENSYGDSFANEIRDKLKGKRALFLRAKDIVSNLDNILKESGVFLDQEVVYETKCSDKKGLKRPQKGSFIIFSSPSTIECFFNSFLWDRSYKAIVIGKKSARYMPKDIEFLISPKQSIDFCISLAKKLELSLRK